MRRAARLAAMLGVAVLALPTPRAWAAEPARAPAVESLARAFVAEIAKARKGAPTGGTVAIAFTAGDDAGPAAGGELGKLVERLLPGLLRERAGFTRTVRVPAGDHAEAVQAASRGGASCLVEADLHLVGTELVLSGTVTPTWVNLWTGETEGAPRTVSARARADRAALLLARAAAGAEPVSGSLLLRPLAQLSGRVVAVAVGDADGDGHAEVVALTDRALYVLRLDSGALHVVATRSLDGRPRALTPSRDPTGGVVIARIALRTVIAYAESGIASGEVLTFDGTRLSPVTSLGEVPLAAAGGSVLYGRLVPGSDTFASRLRLVPAHGPVRHVDAGRPVVSATLDPTGQTVAVVDASWHVAWPGRLGSIGLGPRSTGLRGTVKSIKTAVSTRAAPASGALGPTAGAGIALADLDGDGVLERIGSAPVAPGAHDHLVIATAHGPVRELRPVPGAIRTLATGDLTGDGRDDVVVAASFGDGSWLYLLSEGRP